MEARGRRGESLPLLRLQSCLCASSPSTADRRVLPGGFLCAPEPHRTVWPTPCSLRWEGCPSHPHVHFATTMEMLPRPRGTYFLFACFRRLPVRHSLELPLLHSTAGSPDSRHVPRNLSALTEVTECRRRHSPPRISVLSLLRSCTAASDPLSLLPSSLVHHALGSQEPKQTSAPVRKKSCPSPWCPPCTEIAPRPSLCRI